MQGCLQSELAWPSAMQLSETHMKEQNLKVPTILLSFHGGLGSTAPHVNSLGMV